MIIFSWSVFMTPFDSSQEYEFEYKIIKTLKSLDVHSTLTFQVWEKNGLDDRNF